jgi:hypothetical protein
MKKKKKKKNCVEIKGNLADLKTIHYLWGEGAGGINLSRQLNH